ncbi:universal stress protein [Caldimonas brevitalea]|uniref:UspA domain-containing protein n=1 Tax=Caldimonas brevitalea TaxID=413882 RepID=A0A0G3BSG4_9BURK|nr:universal stress protein [Caldimonas brevitalea]AKJ29490.1 hypothetical protein AAW51_2799 [Caldimonas brevitalea]
MDYRTILVHLDDSVRSAVRGRLAAKLALQHEAHLIGLAPSGLVNLPGQAGADFMHLSLKQLRERAQAVAEGFRQQATGFGVASCEARALEADPLPATVMQGRCSDLVVVGQSGPGRIDQPIPRDFPQLVLLHVGRPVLIVPNVGEWSSVARRVLVAWNPSRECARALHDALPLLRRAEQVHLLFLDRPQDEHDAGRLQFEQVRPALERHGVTLQARVVLTQVDAGNALLAEAADLGADLLVMGGYGHSRLAEFVLGGTTRTVLKQMNLPVLMSH